MAEHNRCRVLSAHLRPLPTSGGPAAVGEASGVPEYQRLSQIPVGPIGPRTSLSDDEKKLFYQDGFIILRGAIPKELTECARKKFNTVRKKDYANLANIAEFSDLINKSCVAEVLRREMGPFTPPQAAQIAVNPPAPEENPGSGPWPEFGNPGLHMDGVWTDNIPRHQSELVGCSHEDPRLGRPRDVAKWWKDEGPYVCGPNQVPLWEDKEKTLSIGNFTAFVFVAINDQTELGRGQTSVLKGGHHVAQEFFRMQAREGGVIGPEGPRWPRLVPVGKDGVMINYMPKAMRDEFVDGAKQQWGWTWPRPTPILMKEGDCCICLHACPHGASTNYGPDPRMNIIFRVRRRREGDPNEGSGRQMTGLSDHPDRTFYINHKINEQSFFKYPAGYDPWKLAKHTLCDHWSEWQGMQSTVAGESAKGPPAKPISATFAAP